VPQTVVNYCLLFNIILAVLIEPEMGY